MSTEISVGARIACEGYYGTVMYYGPVQGSSGVWVGVRWDDLGRGKHDGEYNGNRYFTCEQGHGSFARQEKLTFGVPLSNALKQKYVVETAQEADESEMYVTTVREVKVPVQLIGREKARNRIQKLEILPVADLSGLLVSSIDPPPVLAELLPAVRELDLSGALLHSWDQVFALLDQLSELKVLCLNGVILSPPTSKSPLPSYPNLHVLVLNRTKIPWKQVLELRPIFPALQELHLSENSISQFLDTTNTQTTSSEPINANANPPGKTYDKVTGFDNLQLLNLEGNSIEDWNEVCRFSNLPVLQHLILSGNKIATLYHDRSTTMFPALETFSVSHNKIAKWEVVNELHFLPSLQRVRLNGNPVVAPFTQTVARLYIIGRIGKLKMLNGANVTPQERLDAERYYLRHIISTKSEATNPRYNELMEKHGGPDGINRENTAVSSDQQFYSVTIRGAREIKKTIPGTMTVKELKNFCGRTFEMDASQPISIFMQSRSEFPVELTEDSMNMYNAGIAEGSIIVCSTK